MRLALLAGVWIALLAAACGGGGGTADAGGGPPLTDDAAIRAVLRDFAKAFNDGKAGDVVKLLDSESRRTCDQRSLSKLMSLARAFSGNKKFGLEVKSVRVDGERATAVVVPSVGNEKQDPEDQRLVKQAGVWKVVFEPEDCGV